MNSARSRAALLICLLSLFVFWSCGHLGGGSPTDTYRAYLDAARKLDVAGIKRTMSKASLVAAEASARDKKMTVDDLLLEPVRDHKPETPEFRNETVTGDTATVELKWQASRNWEVWPFVKEDGKWKIAFEKEVKDLP